METFTNYHGDGSSAYYRVEDMGGILLVQEVLDFGKYCRILDTYRIEGDCAELLHRKVMNLELDATKTETEIGNKVFDTTAKQSVAYLGLQQINDPEYISNAIEEVISKFPKQSSEYKSGKKNLLGFFIKTANDMFENLNPKMLSAGFQSKLS